MGAHEPVKTGSVNDTPAAGGGDAGPNGQGTASGGLRAASDRIDQLITTITRAGAEEVRSKVEEAVRLVIELYGAGLAQVFEIVAQEGALGAPLLARFRADGILAELISFHGITFHADLDPGGADGGAGGADGADGAGERGDTGGGRTATGGKNLRQVGDRIEELVRTFSELEDAELKDHAEEVVRLLVDLYGGALERSLEIVDEGGEEVWGLFDRFTADELVRSLLILHGLHPSDLDTRIREAIEKVRPYLKSHGGGVEVLSIDDDGVLMLRLQGSCDGCPSSTLTVKLALERAIKEAAPEITAVRAEGVGERDPAAQGDEVGGGQTSGGLLQIQKRPGVPAPQPVDDWAELDAATAGVEPGRLVRLDLQGAAIVVCRVGESLYAYRDACPGCSSAVGGGRLEDATLACPGCGRTYDVRLAGRCLDAADLHLDPLPLLTEEGTVRVALAAAAG
jgi:Fe-S cluster biogenesis protein NfuA/nitrite reductase/ring-hydroxylating ferredoxin subunit